MLALPLLDGVKVAVHVDAVVLAVDRLHLRGLNDPETTATVNVTEPVGTDGLEDAVSATVNVQFEIWLITMGVEHKRAVDVE